MIPLQHSCASFVIVLRSTDIIISQNKTSLTVMTAASTVGLGPIYVFITLLY